MKKKKVNSLNNKKIVTRSAAIAVSAVVLFAVTPPELYAEGKELVNKVISVFGQTKADQIFALDNITMTANDHALALKDQNLNYITEKNGLGQDKISVKTTIRLKKPKEAYQVKGISLKKDGSDMVEANSGGAYELTVDMDKNTSKDLTFYVCYYYLPEEGDVPTPGKPPATEAITSQQIVYDATAPTITVLDGALDVNDVDTNNDIKDKITFKIVDQISNSKSVGVSADSFLNAKYTKTSGLDEAPLAGDLLIKPTNLVDVYEVSGLTKYQGVYEVTLTGEDIAGNKTGDQKFTVTVNEDTTKPIIKGVESSGKYYLDRIATIKDNVTPSAKLKVTYNEQPNFDMKDSNKLYLEKLRYVDDAPLDQLKKIHVTDEKGFAAEVSFFFKPLPKEEFAQSEDILEVEKEVRAVRKEFDDALAGGFEFAAGRREYYSDKITRLEGILAERMSIAGRWQEIDNLVGGVFQTNVSADDLANIGKANKILNEIISSGKLNEKEIKKAKDEVGRLKDLEERVKTVERIVASLGDFKVTPENVKKSDRGVIEQLLKERKGILSDYSSENPNSGFAKNLSKAQRDKLEIDVQKLETLITLLDSVAAVEKQIETLPPLYDMTVESKNDVREASAGFNKLTDHLKQIVNASYRTKLQQAEEAFKTAEEIQEEIARLPEPEQISAEHVGQIVSANKNYNNLTTKFKNLIEQASKDKLELCVLKARNFVLINNSENTYAEGTFPDGLSLLVQKRSENGQTFTNTDAAIKKKYGGNSKTYSVLELAIMAGSERYNLSGSIVSVSIPIPEELRKPASGKPRVAAAKATEPDFQLMKMENGDPVEIKGNVEGEYYRFETDNLGEFAFAQKKAGEPTKPGGGDGTDKPGDGTDKPGDGTDKPGDGTNKPGDGTNKPGDGTGNGDGSNNGGSNNGGGSITDTNGNGIPDGEEDLNGNGIPDGQEGILGNKNPGQGGVDDDGYLSVNGAQTNDKSKGILAGAIAILSALGIIVAKKK